MSGRVHIVGAGLAGLACAVRLAAAGVPLVLYEAAAQAGGRCRSFDDRRLGRVIDNGNHLLLGANAAAFAYLREIGAGDSLSGPARAVFPFLDLASGERWSLRPGAGRSPLWLLDPARGLPGWRVVDFLAGLRLLLAGPQRRVADGLDCESAAYRRFWEPLTLAALNTDPAEASARLLRDLLRETFGRGEPACRPYVARTGLSASFVDPALARLARAGAELRLGQRLAALEIAGGRVAGLRFGRERRALGAADIVVLAVPPAAAAALLPELPVPQAHNPIVNLHFRLDDPPDGLGEAPFLGLVGGAAHWLFLRGDVASVTVSAARDLAARPVAEIAERLWPEVARALDLPRGRRPRERVIVERRATFAQTPANLRRRPATQTRHANLLLAGDWTATGLPATIDGAIRSGQAAAAAAARQLGVAVPAGAPAHTRNNGISERSAA